MKIETLRDLWQVALDTNSSNWTALSKCDRAYREWKTACAAYEKSHLELKSATTAFVDASQEYDNHATAKHWMNFDFFKVFSTKN